MEKNMSNDKKAQKGMNRAEFAQEYSLDTGKQAQKSNQKQGKSQKIK